jgi:hypothetical protein
VSGPDISLSGTRVVSGTIAIPLYGIWSADVSLSDVENVPSPGASLVIGNLTLACAVYRGSVFAGARGARLIGGQGGWRKDVTARQYALASGVQLSMILRDTASEVGEFAALAEDVTVGVGFVREVGPASRVLRQLAGANWHMRPDGVTQIGPWPTTKITSPFTAVSKRTGAGVVEVATEDYASWLPGATFTSATLGGTYTVDGVEYHIDGNGKVRLEVLTQ